MAQPTTLTQQQIDVLRWIADGCPGGVMTDWSHRISAAALRRRGLVSVTGKGATWTAQVTVGGSDYLKQLDGAEPPIVRGPNVSVTEQLMNDIVAAGGVLRVPWRTYYDRHSVDYEQRARLAERHGKVPAGKWLEIERHRDEIELRLEDMPPGLADAVAELTPVPVRDDVARYHPAARQFRDEKAEHQVSQEQLRRAVRLVHAVAVEAERRGWKAEAETGGLCLRPSGLTVEISITERGVHRRGPWEHEVRRYRNYTRFLRERPVPTGPYDKDATGELELAISVTPGGGFDGRQRCWGDRQSWTLEERLPHLFQEIAVRIVLAERHAVRQRIAAERAAEAARRAKDERERQWHALMADARDRLIEDHHAAHLRAQAEAWHEVNRLRAYCAAVAAEHGGQPDTEEFLAWAGNHVASIDPLTEPPRLPGVPEATVEVLQPYLPSGWSAHGPEFGRGAYRGW